MAEHANFIAPAVGTILVFVPLIRSWLSMPKYRTKNVKNWTYPYKPWKEVDATGGVYRAFRAQENIKEWNNLFIPFLWIAHLFFTALPIVGGSTTIQNMFTVAASVTMAYFNDVYFFKYRKAASDRSGSFKMRKNVTVLVLVTAIAGLVFATLQSLL
jgi:hypothetical protein